jgi:hypothetical protein
MRVQESPAIDRKARRRANRTQRQQGGAQLDLTSMQKRAERDTKLRCTLLNTMLTGDALERAAAAKAKRKLNDVWTNRRMQSLTGFWNPNA